MSTDQNVKDYGGIDGLSTDVFIKEDFPKVTSSKWGSQVPAEVSTSQSTQLQAKQVRQRLWAVIVSATVASIPALLVGCTLGFPSGALLDLVDLEQRPDFKFDSILSDIFGALAPIGALLGGPIAGWIADHAGRKAALMLVGIPYLTGYLMMVYAHFIHTAIAFKVVLLTGRFFTGVGLGWSCLATPVYLAEISSNRLRGIFSSFTQLFLSLGILLIYLLGSFESFQYYNSSLVLVGILVMFELSMLFLYETPRWLLAHKQRALAIKVLKFLRGPRFEIGIELTVIENGIAKHPHLKISQALVELTKRKVLLPLLIVLGVMFFQQIGGLNASTAYSALIFKEANVENYRVTSTYAIGAVSVLFTVVAAFIVDLIGRKTLLILSGIGMLIATVTLGTFFYVTRPSLCDNTTLGFVADSADVVVCNPSLAPLAVASLIVFNAAFSIGWGPVPWILLGELIPLRVRGVGSGIATFVNWGAAAIVTGFYLNYAEAVNTWFAWWTFSIMNLVAIVFVVVFVFETKGKNLEDIQHRFDKKHHK